MDSNTDFSALIDIYGAPEPTKREVIEEIDTCWRPGASLSVQPHQAPDRGATVEAPTSFLPFALLTAEIRLMIWNAALEEPCVVNIFMKYRDRRGYFEPPSRFTVLNTKSLHQRSAINSLLSVNYEARSIAQDYLDTHFVDEAQAALPWGSKGCRKHWRALHDLGAQLLNLRIDPQKDILFLNGLDLEPVFDGDTPTNVFLTPDPADPPLLPERLRGQTLHPHPSPNTRRLHTRGLGETEALFTGRFNTIIMPIHGLVDQRAPEGLFQHPWNYTPDTNLCPPTDKTFIALVGHYRGRNLQMDDLEFIPDAEVARIRREAWGRSTGWTTSNANTRVASSVLHRDVLVMTAVWEEWAGRRGSLEDGYKWGRGIPLCQLGWDAHVVECVRLRFARVKQEALDRLRPGDMHTCLPG